MNATTMAVDLAKKVFELALADGGWRLVERARLTRAQFERWFDNRKVDLVLMEACGSKHYWARTLRTPGTEVRLLPAQPTVAMRNPARHGNNGRTGTGKSR